ncbi:hypothetical protein GCM10020216_039900 [Nonomuraea helvata]
MSTDLRDGNQSLAKPMDPGRKLAMFELLVEMGYKEIEVGFPVASRDDHVFVRMLIEEERIPDDVWISILVPARDEMIAQSIEALRGAPRVTFHLYNSLAPTFRKLVLTMSRTECKDLAVQGTRLMMKHAERALAHCDLRFQYSPEAFNETEPDFAVEVCEAVLDVWQPDAERQMILNFPATVERSQPHVFADQIEWLNRALSPREHVCLSIHPHNDRGTAVAATELALLAGAERVEGCLFGSGERAGNVCLVTLGMNLLLQGIDPGIDFSDIDRIKAVAEDCTAMPVPPRYPYAGELVYTAFSGSHQDAIKKGLDAMAQCAAETGVPVEELPWQVPYLPLDPRDIGRSHESMVRINSQSGKGGVAYVMAMHHGVEVEHGRRREFADVVQSLADDEGGEISPDRIGAAWDAMNGGTS